MWNAVERNRNLAVVDPLIVPRKQNYGFGAFSDFKLEGFYLEDGAFSPVPIVVRDPQTGKSLRLTVIGVMADTAPLAMAGIWTSQTHARRGLREPRRANRPFLCAAARRGTRRNGAASRVGLSGKWHAGRRLEEAARRRRLGQPHVRPPHHRLHGPRPDRGVAALGVISARSVVERRQQIGVLRAIGFRRSMVQACFLLESSFLAVTAIIVGTTLGLAVGYNVIADSRRQPSWSELPFHVPWVTLGLIFLAVYGVAMLTTLAPARRASHVYPAEALRYQ